MPDNLYPIALQILRMLYTKGVGSVHLIQVPVHGVLVVDHCGNEADHQTPAAPRLTVAIPVKQAAIIRSHWSFVGGRER
jgi:hypothetical protein